MLINKIKELKDIFHAELCYHIFATPFGAPLEKKYRNIARLACEYLEKERTEIIKYQHPRHHVIHRFAQVKDNAKKILILHGWMSRAAYMARLIRVLHLAGFDVYAIDFPAHGEAKGVQLPWADAMKIVKTIIDNNGPFYGIIGHSFGGSVAISALNLSSQYEDWSLQNNPERMILLASPTRVRTPLLPLARYFKLSAKGYLHLRKVFYKKTIIDLRSFGFRHYIKSGNIPILCIHGENDIVVPPIDSVHFCQEYKHSKLSILPNVDHVSILFNDNVEKNILDFLRH